MKTRAFTLVEMLVVMAILGILSALLLPALARGKIKAREMYCRNNLSQIGKALSMYLGDFHKYPGSRGAPTGIPANSPTQYVNWQYMWDQRLLPYAGGKTAVFDCPSEHPSSHGGITNYSYGYNAYGTALLLPQLSLGLGRDLPPDPDPADPRTVVGESQVQAPADMLAVGDLNDFPQGFMATFIPQVTAPWLGGPSARHRGGANFVFCDGHLEFAERLAWSAATPAARRRWNNDHEPHPETW